MEQGSENSPPSNKRLAAIVAFCICFLAFCAAVTWFFWPESSATTPIVAQSGGNAQSNPPDNSATNSPPDVAPIAQVPAGGGQPNGGRRGNRPPPADLTPQAIDPVLIADSSSNDAFHPSRAGGLTLNQLLGDLAPSTVPPATTSVPTTQATDEAVRLENARKYVMALCTDHSGNLWVGTEEGGIQCWNPATNQWRQFTTRDGVGDDFCYALACDKEGRIWAGHLNHGVSVFNGQKWQNYEVVGGLSRPDTLSGPLGERVFAIKVCPTDGDVWIANNCGLARYSDSKNTWQYYTMENGLPSDQANALAFDPDGNLYVATQCDGIAIAKASEDYAHWQQVTGPASDAEPQSADGDGLPSNLMNDILVAKNGTIYAATDAGLGFSKDRGQSWKFIRGKDWQDKVRGLMVNDPVPGTGRRGGQRLQLTGDGALAEDYCTCLAETSDGKLWVGHRQKDVEVFDADLNRIGNVPIALNDPWVHAMVAEGIPMVGTHADGLQPPLNSSQPTAVAAAYSTPATNPPVLPAGALPPSREQIEAMTEKVKSLATTRAVAEFIGDDWRTQGDWVGRYGKQWALLCAADRHIDEQEFVGGVPYDVKASIGPHHDNLDVLRHWVQSPETTDLRSLYDPAVGHRVQADWDDHGESYAWTREGPDLHATVTLPVGITRVAFYFFNYNRLLRDYVIELRKADADESSPPLAHCRLENFYGGIYKQFVFVGPGEFNFIIRRNHSMNTICSGVFIDRIQGPMTFMDDPGMPTMPHFAYVHYDAPAISPGTASLEMDPALQLWNALDTYPMAPRVMGRYQRLLAYRSAVTNKPDKALLGNWRWPLQLWNDGDRTEFDAVMARAWHDDNLDTVEREKTRPPRVSNQMK